MPSFKIGKKLVYFKGLAWLKVGETSGFDFEDGFDRYFAIYMPKGLMMKEYQEKYQSFKNEIDSLLKR
ncbi:hypothetical protein GT022_17865 [Agaribacter marinus]|uniref:Uncharacterized protein n=1 Tax=Virgibacillus salarius TaxID=447199 RepID=A0A941DW66_9BACI|nr:hypothetical protein [Virgibacillus salarius]MBR7797900.1 hypothetical protein [Virgibacillus salarius]NAZ10610.1 hypothetical protein [Agaribacter marinus]